MSYSGLPGHALVSSSGFTRSSRGFDTTRDPVAQDAIHRLYLATCSSSGSNWKPSDAQPGLAIPTLGPKRHLTPVLDTKPRTTRTLGWREPPEPQPPVSTQPPMCLEDVVVNSRWQRTRGIPHSRPAAPAVTGSRRSQSSSLVPAARQVLEKRGHAREAKFRMSSTFTDGRRRVALMRCIQDLERKKVDPTLGEISKGLMQEGWETGEVEEHLLLLANDTNKWNVTSGRELGELRPRQSSNLPAIVEACGGSGHVECAQKLRNVVQAFRFENSRAANFKGILDEPSRHQRAPKSPSRSIDLPSKTIGKDVNSFLMTAAIL